MKHAVLARVAAKVSDKRLDPTISSHDLNEILTEVHENTDALTINTKLAFNLHRISQGLANRPQELASGSFMVSRARTLPSTLYALYISLIASIEGLTTSTPSHRWISFSAIDLDSVIVSSSRPSPSSEGVMKMDIEPTTPIHSLVFTLLLHFIHYCRVLPWLSRPYLFRDHLQGLWRKPRQR